MGGRQRDHEQSGKKIKPSTREPNGAIFMLRCAELGLSDAELEGMSIGMVYDMLIERANDQENYPLQATQEDIYAFFGGGS